MKQTPRLSTSRLPLPSLGAGNDKPGTGLKLSQYSQSKKAIRSSKDKSDEDSLSQRSSDEDSPNTREQKRLLQIKEKEQMKIKMLKDFKQFVMVQQQQYSLNTENDEHSSISSTNLNNLLNPKRGNSSGGYVKLNTQTSLKLIEPNESVNSGRSLSKQASITSMFAPIPLAQQNSQPSSSQTVLLPASINSAASNSRPNLKRQNSIAQTMQKRLKIVHKTKEQLFNDKLKMFKGVSTYVETKQFLQGLNVLNSRKLAEDVQQTIKLNSKFDILQNRLQMIKSEKQKEEEIEDEEAEKQRLAHVKYNKDNPYFQRNVHELLGKAHAILKSTPAPISQTEVKATQLFENVKINIEQDKAVNAYDFSDENQFFDSLRQELIQGDMKHQLKQDNTTTGNTDEENKKKAQRRAREIQILNEIYTSTELVDQLSSEQIKEFINQRIEKEMDPNFNPIKNAQSKEAQKQLTQLNINENTKLESKTLYSEYVEKANQVRNRLHRLNQVFFKQKWANAMMKNKQEKEQIRKDILSKIQNAEINSSKIDVLFPGKKKMGNIKSRVDSGLNQDEYEEQNRNTMNVIQKQSDANKNLRGQNYVDSPKSNHSNSSKINIVSSQNSRQYIPINQSNFNSRATTTLNAFSSLNSAHSAHFTYKNPKSLTATPMNKSSNGSPKKLDNNIDGSQTLFFASSSLQKNQNYAGNQKQVQKHSHTMSVPIFNKLSLNSTNSKLFSQQPVNNSHINHNRSANISSHFLPSATLSHLGSFKQIDNTTNNAASYRQFRSDSNQSFRRITTSIDQKENIGKGEEAFKQQQSGSKAYLTINLSETLQKKISNSPRNSQQQTQSIEQNLEFTSQKDKLNAILGGIEAQRVTRKKESKQIVKELSEIQVSCEEDLRKLKGEVMDNISKVLEIDFLEFTKNDRAYVSDSNIKSFLNKND